MPIPELASGGGIGQVHHKAYLANLGNQDFEVTVYIDGPGGARWSASTKFAIDVIIELTRVTEEQEEEEEEGGVGERAMGLAGGRGGGRGELGRDDNKFTQEDLRVLPQCAQHGMIPRRRPARIYDGFTYRDEFDLLQVRAEEIGDLVVKMILVESSRTHQGKQRELHFETAAARLSADVRQVEAYI